MAPKEATGYSQRIRKMSPGTSILDHVRSHGNSVRFRTIQDGDTQDEDRNHDAGQFGNSCNRSLTPPPTIC